MAIFDNFRASVSKTMRQASDSAKIYADKSRLKKEIAAMEHDLNVCYRDLGETFYRENKDNPVAPYQEIIRNISQIQASAAERQRELNLLLGMQLCPECGAPVAVTARFCSACGAKAPELPEPVVPQAVCQICGQPVDPEGVFCSNCGNRLNASGAAVSPFAAQKPALPVNTPEKPAQPDEPAEDNTAKPDNEPEMIDVPPSELKDAADEINERSDEPEKKTDDSPKQNQDDITPKEPAQAPAMVCPNCGEPLAPDALFCACCGNMVPGLE